MDPTLSFKTKRLGLARFFKSSMTMHTKWSCHPIYKLQTPSMFDTWFHMCMVEFLQLNLEAKFSRNEGLMPIVLHFIPFLFYCFIMLLLLSLGILLFCYGHLCTLYWVYDWLVIFCFVLAVKREYNPSGLEGEGVVEYFVKVCFLKSKNHLERLSFLSQGFITFLYCEFSLHTPCLDAIPPLT